MSRKKLKNGERQVKTFRLHKSLVIALPQEFIKEPTMLKQILIDENNLLLRKGDQND
jgi:hypothetical protein